jgi:(p)ppGpp synthase/HD superfamily hydrolase
MKAEDRDQFHKEFERALAFATRLHAKQLRKETDIPYISHLIGVASLVLEHDGDRDEAIAALLHDSLEDQAEHFPGGLERLKQVIREHYGGKVLGIVEECTDNSTLPKEKWRERKESYIAHLDTATPSGRLVSCADKLHNARAIVSDLRVMGDSLFDRFRGGRDTLWYYRALADVFLRCGPARLAEELDRVVREMWELACGPVRDLRANPESGRLVTP